ncbi:MAG: phosphate regulon sensor histidine kinase PhoR [Gammaproteobacteria bacterium]|nr:phosphate regulon sensor histidine kinase PhoR [Gammaproteobacteria bacterium]
MKEDFWRLLAIVIFSFLLGLLTGHILLCLLIGLAGFMYWQYRALRQLMLWLHGRSAQVPPDTPSLVDEIAREFEYQGLQQQHHKQKLSGMLKRFQEAISALPDAVVALGEHDEIEWANEKAQNYIGVKWPQDSGQRISNLVRYPKLVALLANKSEINLARRIEIISPVNQNLRIEVRIAPYGENQRLLVARNITRIHRANQMRSDFIANASHELRTPLTVVAGYLEAFGNDDEGSPDLWREQIERMRKQTTRMQRLIDDLLRLASLESEIDQESHDEVNITDLIEIIAREAKDLSGKLSHKIVVKANPDLWLKGRYKELHSAFSNIVFNAIKYSPEKANIEISWYRDENGAHFSVRDHGDGIAAEHIPRLTERFYRVDEGRSREKGGTGLGLAIVKHVLARHEASLHIDSEHGDGSIFRCDFPEKAIIDKSATPLPESLSA